MFVWTREDMVGVDLTKFVHCVNVKTNVKPVKQKQRRFAPEQNKIINKEVERLLET